MFDTVRLPKLHLKRPHRWPFSNGFNRRSGSAYNINTTFIASDPESNMYATTSSPFIISSISRNVAARDQRVPDDCSVVYLDEDDDENDDGTDKSQIDTANMQQEYPIALHRHVPRQQETIDVGATLATRSGVVLGVPLKCNAPSTIIAKNSVASRRTGGSGMQRGSGHVRDMNHEKFQPCRCDSTENDANMSSEWVTGGEHENAIRKCNQRQQQQHQCDDDKSVMPFASHGNNHQLGFGRSANETNESVREVVVPPPRRRRQRRRADLQTSDMNVTDSSLPCTVNDGSYYESRNCDAVGMADGSSHVGGYSLDFSAMYVAPSDDISQVGRDNLAKG